MKEIMETKITEEMSFQEAVKYLGIERYAERIWNSNSHGELFHCDDYIWLAQWYKNNNFDSGGFSNWFDLVVDFAEKHWERPVSVFQHVLKIIADSDPKDKNK